MHFAGTGRLQYSTERGNPFLPYYYEVSALIYQNPDYDYDLYFRIEERSFLKKMCSCKNTFFHDYELLATETRRHQQSGWEVSPFLAYHSVYNALIHELEGLYIGPFLSKQNLHERITDLILYLPELQRLFVKKSEKSYYLIHSLEAAAVPNAAEDDCYLNSDLLPCLEKIAHQLYELVVQRYKTMKRGLHFPYVGGVTVEKLGLKEELVAQVVTVLTKIAALEEIYLFHTKETASVLDKTTAHFLFYVLLIGKGIGNDMLLAIQQSVADLTQQQCTVIAIAHSRYFIQHNLYALQAFFQPIMQPEHLIYASHSQHAVLHWQENHTTYYADLGIFQPRAARYLEQFKTLIMHRCEENTDAVFLLFAHAFTHLLRTYLYRSLFSYQPNQLATYSLWKLAVYSNPKLEKMEFLFEKMGKGFYTDIDVHLRFSNRSSRVDEMAIKVLEEILMVLVEEIGED